MGTHRTQIRCLSQLVRIRTTPSKCITCKLPAVTNKRMAILAAAMSPTEKHSETSEKSMFTHQALLTRKEPPHTTVRLWTSRPLRLFQTHWTILSIKLMEHTQTDTTTTTTMDITAARATLQVTTPHQNHMPSQHTEDMKVSEEKENHRRTIRSAKKKSRRRAKNEKTREARRLKRKIKRTKRRLPRRQRRLPSKSHEAWACDQALSIERHSWLHTLSKEKIIFLKSG